MASVSQHHGKHAAEQERNHLFVLEHALFHKYTADADKTESERIVEQELHRVNDERVLQRLQYAVNRAHDKSPSRAEHTAVNHKRKKTCERNRSALRQFEKFCIRQRKRKRDRDCAVNDRASVAHLALVADEPHHHHHHHKHDCGHDHSDEVCVRVIVCNIAVVLRHKHHRGDKATERQNGCDDKGNLDRLIAEKRTYEHCDCPRDHGYERCEYGVKEFCLHIVDVALEFDVGKHHDHSYGKARRYAYDILFEIGKLVTSFEPHEQADDYKRRYQRNRKVKRNELQLVAQRFDIHKKSPPAIWGT